MRAVTTTTVSIAALCLLAGPMADRVAAQNREHQQLAADMRMLQEQTQQLAITLSALTAALDEALGAMNTRIDELKDRTLKGFADQRLLVDSFDTDLRVIRERVDETNVRVSSLGQEVDALRTYMPLLLQLRVGDPDAVTDQDGVLLPPELEAPGTTSIVGLSPTRMYDTAFADYSAGQWTLAITGFEAFMRTFPTSEQADDAQFYVGETYFHQNLFEQSVAAYNQVINDYPTANSVPPAYYKRGLAQERLGQPEDARASWERVATDFPDSDAGRLAMQNLDRLDRQGP